MRGNEVFEFDADELAVEARVLCDENRGVVWLAAIAAAFVMSLEAVMVELRECVVLELVRLLDDPCRTVDEDDALPLAEELLLVVEDPLALAFELERTRWFDLECAEPALGT